MRNRLLTRVSVCAAVLLLVASAWAQTKPRWSPAYEKKIGDETARQVEKQYKVIDDPANLKRLTDIVQALAPLTARPDVKYVVKIIDCKEVNAFSIPGGYVYVTKALLTDSQSDDELAGVLAHELTHNTFYDALEGAKKNEKLFMGSLAAALGAMLVGGKGSQVSAALAAGEYIRLGIMCQYSLDVESRADSYGLKCLIACKKYNPVGMLTFMERLAAKERHKPKQELGIYADHPDTDVRARLILEQLEAANVEINRRAVTKWDPAKVSEKDVGGQKVSVLSLWGVDLCPVRTPGETGTPADRAKGLADALTQSLAAGLSEYEIHADLKSPQPRVMLGERAWLTVTPADAQAAGMPASDLANQIVSNLDTALDKEVLARLW